MKKLEEYWQARLKKQQVPVPVPFNFFLYIFLASCGGPPLCPEFIQYPAAPQDHCGRCRIRTRNLCASEVWRATSVATTSPVATTSSLILVLQNFYFTIFEKFPSVPWPVFLCRDRRPGTYCILLLFSSIVRCQDLVSLNILLIPSTGITPIAI